MTPFRIEILVRAVVVVAVVLSGLANYRADAGACCSPDESALQAAAEDCTKNCATSAADKSALAGADTALIRGLAVIVVVVVVVVRVPVVVVVAAVSALAHAVVVGTVMLILCVRARNTRCEQ